MSEEKRIIRKCTLDNDLFHIHGFPKENKIFVDDIDEVVYITYGDSVFGATLFHKKSFDEVLLRQKYKKNR